METGAREAVWIKKIKPDYSNYMGIVFEKVCMDYLKEKNAKGELPFLFTSIGRWWGTNPVTRNQVEIDIVANDNKDFLIDKCKWKNEKLDITILRQLKEKADIFHKNRENTWYVLFSKSGFTEAVIEEAEKDKNILLVDVNKLMEVS